MRQLRKEFFPKTSNSLFAEHMDDFAEIILGFTNRAAESHQGVRERGHDNAGEALGSHSAAKVAVPQGEKAVSE